MTSRSIEARTTSSFLASASAMPSALLIEGEPGIGKTTLWLAAVEQARDRAFRVLSARAAAAESVLAYTALADLFDGVDAAAWPELPAPQRLAVDQVLLRADYGAATDQRAVAAAFLSVVQRLSDDGPVLLAIDDLQWLDVSTMHVVAFAARRLSGPVGFLGSVRTEVGSGASAGWLQMPRPDAVSRIRLHPMGIHDLHAAVSARLRRSFSRPTIGRIHEVSGGNPFYAIELARTIDERVPGVETSLPRTLAELVRARIGNLDPDVHDALLAASCMSTPTVELVSSATISDDDRVVELLEHAESNGIIAIDGNRIHFAHPLLARGVYTEAAPGQRRTMHRRLAEIVDEPELRARHLALAATRGDDVTLRALDNAAESARHARCARGGRRADRPGNRARRKHRPPSTAVGDPPFRCRQPGTRGGHAGGRDRATGARRPTRGSSVPVGGRASLQRRFLRRRPSARTGADRGRATTVHCEWAC